MPIVADVKGLAGEIHQNETGHIGINLLTGQLPAHDETRLQDVIEAVTDAVRVVLALKAIL